MTGNEINDENHPDSSEVKPATQNDQPAAHIVDPTPRGDFNLLGVARDKRPKNKAFLVIGVGISIMLIGIGLIVWFAVAAYRNAVPEQVDESKVKADAALNSAQAPDDAMKKKQQEILDKKREQARLNAAQKQDNHNASPPPQTPDVPEVAKVDETLQRKLAGGVLAIDANGSNATGDSGSVADTDEARIQGYANRPAPDIPDSGDPGSMADTGTSSGSGRGELNNLTGTQYAPQRAHMMPNPKYLLKQRANIRCSLYTAVKTDHPGFVSCQLIQPLYSANGSVLLADAGAFLYGEQKVEIKPGQTSVFTSWSQLETSNGVRANLNGLGTGALGASGTDAYVDNHYGDRFGGAVMLSFIQDAFTSAANATQKNNSTYSFDNSQSNAEDMAGKALENSINIPPTGYVLPGTVINVMVAQDIDFSSVFTTRH